MRRMLASFSVAMVSGILAACGSTPTTAPQQSPSVTPKASPAAPKVLSGRVEIRCVGPAASHSTPPPVPAPKGAYIEFGPGSKVRGNDGANDWEGTARVTGSTLRIENLSTTLVGNMAPMAAAFTALESGHPTTVRWTDGSPAVKPSVTFVVDGWLLTSVKGC